MTDRQTDRRHRKKNVSDYWIPTVIQLPPKSNPLFMGHAVPCYAIATGQTIKCRNRVVTDL